MPGRRARLFLFVGAVACACFVIGLRLGIERTAPPARLEPVVVAEVIAASGLPLSRLDGEPATPAFAAGPALLNFWASWCPPCLDELPLLDEVARDCPGRVVGFVLDERGEGQRVAGELDLGFPSYLTEPGLDGIDLMPKLGNARSVMPYSILIDERGMLARTKSGDFADVAEIREFMGGVC